MLGKGLRFDACGASTCPVGAGVAPTAGGGAGPRWGRSSSVWRESACLYVTGADAPAAAGAHPHPVPSPPRAAGRTPGCAGGRNPPPTAGARPADGRKLPPTAGSRASLSALRGWEVPPGRWGCLPLERSREWEGGRGGASLAPGCAAPPAHAHAGRARSTVGATRAVPAPTPCVLAGTVGATRQDRPPCRTGTGPREWESDRRSGRPAAEALQEDVQEASRRRRLLSRVREDGAAVAMTSSTSDTDTSARNSPAARARSTSCPTTSSNSAAPPSSSRSSDTSRSSPAGCVRCCGNSPRSSATPTRSTCGGSSRPAPEATDVRRKRDSADHGSSSWPSAARACSVSRDVSSSAIRRTSTSLLGNRRYTVPTPTRARRATSSIGAPYPSSPKTSRAARSTCSRLRWASTRSGVVRAPSGRPPEAALIVAPEATADDHRES